jgi:hypothetical protein
MELPSLTASSAGIVLNKNYWVKENEEQNEEKEGM